MIGSRIATAISIKRRGSPAWRSRGCASRRPIPPVPESAIILGDYKLIKKHDAGSLELFNLSTDISEENELSQKQPEVLARMKKELTRRLEETKAQMATPNPDYDPDAARPRPPGPGGKKRGAR